MDLSAMRALRSDAAAFVQWGCFLPVDESLTPRVMNMGPMPESPFPRVPDDPRASAAGERTSSARNAIVQRLTEIVSWPESRIPAYERQLAADILVGLLRTSGMALRRRCANGLVLI